MGPERLPEAIRAISLWIGRLKQLLAKTRQEIENEVGMDDIRHQLHNEQVLKELGEHKDQLEQSLDNHKTGQPWNGPNKRIAEETKNKGREPS